MDLKFAGKYFLEQMPDTPTRGSQHRRAHSETHFRFPGLDDFLLDDLPPTPPSLLPPAPPHHSRSLSMDADFFEGLSLDAQAPSASPAPKHRHSNSMDGYSSATSSEMDSGIKKAMPADRLSELALLDPKRAKRILANRQSAARSKERKTRYTSELERKVQTLQTEATTLSAQITVLQRDASGLTAENKELKLKLQALQQQAELREALNEALRNELQHLKIAAGQASSPPPPSLHYFSNHHQQQQQQQQRLSSANDLQLNASQPGSRFQ